MTNKAQAGGQVMSDIQETIDRLRELDRYASPAPWRYVSDCDYMKAGVRLGDIVDVGGRVVVPESPYVLGGPFEREVIIQTRNALPDLLAEIGRLKAENAKAWDDGYKQGQLSGIRTSRTGHVQPYKNPYKENRK